MLIDKVCLYVRFGLLDFKILAVFNKEIKKHFKAD